MNPRGLEMPDKVDLICKPTPLHPLLRLSPRLGCDLNIKRDDLTGLALGGNKGRKLEYLIADVLATGCDTVVTCGSAQSNFIRQLGAACSMFGLRCAALSMSLPYEDAQPASPGLADSNGNVLLDHLLGVDLRIHPNGTWEELYAATEDLATELEREGRNVYRCPIGGSTPLGAYAFYLAGQEVFHQAVEFDWIVFASSSGSTHVGLATYFKGSRTRVLGIACDPEPEIGEDFAALSGQLSALTGLPTLSAAEFQLRFDYVGEGYGVPSPAGQAAIETMARHEGIFLDPIYTGKAFAGLLDLVEKREIGGRILFWHTGGVPALFA